MNKSFQKMRRGKLPRINTIALDHVEMDEELPVGTQEMVEEFVAESLFRMWITDGGKERKENECGSVHS